MNDISASYLDGLPAPTKERLCQVNRPALTALREYLVAGEAVAILGAGASAPPYPMWDGLIGELVDSTADRLETREAEALRALAVRSPEEVVEILRRRLSSAVYWEALRAVLRIRLEPDTGHSWTPVQELVCRCAFKGVVTTAYDPGIADARIRVRGNASATGFTTWEDELALDRWRTGEIFADTELPVLFAHGHHAQPNGVVLATTEYRRAYAGKLSGVLRRLLDGEHVVWIGFGFADQRIAAIIRETISGSGTRLELGGAPRHVAILPWDPTERGNDPGTLARRAEIGYGAQAVLYPAPSNSHSALKSLLSMLTDSRYPAVGDPAARVLDMRPSHGRSREAPARNPILPKPSGHAFISYSREDAGDVDKLHRLLETAGLRVWRDTVDLWPGEDWRAKIRRAITSDTLVFLACFSVKSLARKISYQNEEILLAISQMRLRRPGEPWLIPVRFDQCLIPDIDLGGGRSLASIQCADLFGPQYEHNAAKLVTAIQRTLERHSSHHDLFPT